MCPGGPIELEDQEAQRSKDQGEGAHGPGELPGSAGAHPADSYVPFPSPFGHGTTLQEDRLSSVRTIASWRSGWRTSQVALLLVADRQLVECFVRASVLSSCVAFAWPQAPGLLASHARGKWREANPGSRSPGDCGPHSCLLGGVGISPSDYRLTGTTRVPEVDPASDIAHEAGDSDEVHHDALANFRRSR